MNYMRNKKYFADTSFVLLGGKPWMKLIFLPFSIIGHIIKLISIIGKPTDQNYDRLVLNEIVDIREEGLRRIGIDVEEINKIEPLIIHGPLFSDITTPYLFIQGKDKRYRSSNYSSTIFFFGDEQIYMYQYKFSMIGDEESHLTEEYFYTDLVSVTTYSEKEKVKNKKGKEQAFTIEFFKLTTTGGTFLKTSLWDSGSIERQIQGMKSLIREKKKEK